MSCIINPATGRAISTTGATYKKLLKQGKLHGEGKATVEKIKATAEKIKERRKGRTGKKTAREAAPRVDTAEAKSTTETKEGLLKKAETLKGEINELTKKADLATKDEARTVSKTTRELLDKVHQKRLERLGLLKRAKAMK